MVLVINCPREDTYEVFLTNLMQNTTLSAITNEIIGKDDKDFTDDPDLDFTRRILVEDIKVAFVKKTNEVGDATLKDGLIVVAKNETSGAGSNQYSVTRYWQNIYTNWIESEHLFDLVNGPYDDIFVFDNYAIVIKDKKEVKAVFFDKFRQNLVPWNFEVVIYDGLKATDSTFEAVTYWDLSGRGDWQMLGAVRTPGAITLFTFEEAINPEN